ncbi:MAG TPA: helix-turn-helix domain-containing protein, partial [Miltoncostaeaceae bacterium]|nr:helix-turn-helix domain-containing protein [Miltoncostaeaceae bacterium]
MFEIGNALREARRRQGLDLAACEQATKIRAKYLMALEEERFEALPEPAYVRGMLRAYAEFLDVDSAPVLEEYGHRVGGSTMPAPETIHTAPSRRPRPSGRRPRGGRRRRRRLDGRLAWLALGSMGAVGAVVWLGT